MEKKQVNCPNCGAPIDENAPKNCPYCGGSLPQLNSESTKDKKNIKFDKIVGFMASEENAIQKLVKEFVFSGSNIALLAANPEIIAKKVYIPVWLIKGEYCAPWSCIKDEFIPIPMNGQASGSFEISTNALSKKPAPDVRHYQMEDFLQSKIDKKAIVYDADIEKDELFIKLKIKHEIEYTAKSAVEKQLPEKYRDLSWSFTYSNLKCFCVLVACWELTYEYNGGRYVCYASGRNGNPFSTVIPRPSKAEMDFKPENVSSKPERWNIDIKPIINLTFFGWSCFFLLLFALVFGLYGLAKSYPAIIWSNVILVILSNVLGTRMIFKQEDEKSLLSDIVRTEREVKSKISKNESISKHNEQLQYILSTNSPMIEPYRAELEKRLLKTVDIGKTELTSQVSFYHNKLSAHKRLRFLYSLILSIMTLITIILGINAINSREQSIRAEQARIEQEQLQKQFQEQQAEESLKKEIENKRNEQKQREKTALGFISPKNLLTVDKNGCYQLRDDFAQALQKAGFEKREKVSFDHTISYIFHVDDISDDGSISQHDYLSVDINDIQYEAFNDIYERNQYITFKGQFDLDFINRLANQLKQQGFEVRKRDSDYPDFYCTREKTLDNEIAENTYMKNKVSIALRSYEIKFVISQEPHTKIKDP